VWSRFLRSFEGNPHRAERAVWLLTRLAAAGLCTLVAATWPLWMPGGEFPRVPLFGWFARVPNWLDWAALAGLQIAGLAAVIGGTRSPVSRWTVSVLVIAFGALVPADQHRLQPWAYQLVLLEIVLSGSSAREAIALTRMLTVSIYFFSAVSKLDQSFLSSGGGQIVDGLLKCFGLAGRVGDENRMLLAGCLTTAELLVALGLCWRRSRKFAWPASIAIHVLLLAALGPWGAQNKPGVLLWNVYFILQNLVLFGVAGELPTATEATAPSSGVPRAVAERATYLQGAIRGVTLLAILFPLTEPFGICDVWQAWGVYATRPERLRVFIRAADRDRVPSAIRTYVQAPRFEDGLCLVRIDRWSLDASGAAIYPQNRFRLGIALAIADQAALGEAITVELDGPADRLTGARSSRQFQGRAAIAAELERYWLNGFPCESFGRAD
jgi:hypothetical protein